MADRSDIDLVRERADILQVVAPYVALKRSGRTWKGLCPFHSEKTPSFHVDPERGSWYCHGQCSEGGDVFKFVQKIDNLSFPEALERLALASSVVLTPRRGPGERRSEGSYGEAASQKTRLFAAVESAARFYEESLTRSQGACRYLEERGILRQTQQQFRLGYAPEDWEALWQYLSRHGVALGDAVAAGLLAAGDRGGHYDKLRGRIIFPILDAQERPIGFGGRLLAASGDRPKYLNSAETPLFSKGRTLYGLWRARKPIVAAEQAIVVEGYMDVIAAHQAGIENVVAALGTSLTEQHAQVLARFAQRVLLSFDADAAGLKAANRATHIFEAQGVETRMLDLPEGEDPDSLLRAGRKSEFARAIDQALPVAEYNLRKILARPGLLNAAEREKLTVFRREALPLLRGTGSVMERERLIRLCAPLHPQYGAGAAYAEEQIRQEIEQAPGRSLTGSSQPAWGAPRFTERGYSRPAMRRAERVGGLIPIEARTAEEILLRALLAADADKKERIVGELCPQDFPTPAYRALAEWLFEGDRDSERRDENAEISSLAARLQIDNEPVDAKAIDDSMARLKKFTLRQRAETLRAKAIEGDRHAAAELLGLQQQQRH